MEASVCAVAASAAVAATTAPALAGSACLLLLLLLLLAQFHLQQQETQPHPFFCWVPVHTRCDLLRVLQLRLPAAPAVAAASAVLGLSQACCTCCCCCCRQHLRQHTLPPSTVDPNMYRAFHWHSLLL